MKVKMQLQLEASSTYHAYQRLDELVGHLKRMNGVGGGGGSGPNWYKIDITDVSPLSAQEIVHLRELLADKASP